VRHYSIEGRKNSLSVIIIVMVIAIINVMTIIALLLPQPFDFLKEDAKASCTGIRFFYTGTSFYRDYVGMKKIHAMLPTFTDNNNIVSPPVYMLIPFRGYDCEDFAHAVSCLAKYYGQKVYFYNVYWQNLDTKEKGYHIGFCFWAEGKLTCDNKNGY